MRIRQLFFHGFRFFSMNTNNKVMSTPSCCCAQRPSSSPEVILIEESDVKYAMYESLKDLCHNNANHFKNDDSDAGVRLHAGFISLLVNTDTVLPLVDLVRKVNYFFRNFTSS